MKMMRDYLVLFINGNRVRIDGEQACWTLADFLRSQLGLKGTKVVCAEGDCGACSVLLGTLSEDSNTFRYRSIDACIVFMYQLDRTHVVSVEGLREPQGTELSAVQAAMVRCHGSQCGFCTPGFVVALHGLCEENFSGARDGSPSRLDEKTLRLGLSGNLCRCTGYVQILEAGLSVDSAEIRRMNAIYPPAPIRDSLQPLARDSVRMIAGDQTILIPRTIQEAVEWKSNFPEARVVGGATDVGVWHNHGRPAAQVTLCLVGLDGLRGVEDGEEEMTIGANATWATLGEAFQDPFPEMSLLLTRFGSPQIRNLGTIAGNLINASPIADSIPFLMSLEATLNLISVRGVRRVPITEFYCGYKQMDLQPDELLQSITCPKLLPQQRLKLYKISRRRDMDISTLTAAFLLSIDEDRIVEGRVALGGVGPVVMRLPNTEADWQGKPWSIETMRSAGAIAANEITAISDVRGSQWYRRTLAENIFVKCYYDLTTPAEVTV